MPPKNTTTKGSAEGPPKEPQRPRRSSTRKPSDANSDKSSMFNLPDPNWLIDSRSDPARHEERSDRSKRTAARRKNMFQPAEASMTKPDSTKNMPGAFPTTTEEGHHIGQDSAIESLHSLSETATGMEMVLLPTIPLTRSIPMFTYPSQRGDQIHREIHEETPREGRLDENPTPLPNLSPIISPQPPHAPASVRTTSSDARRNSEEIRKLREEMEKLQRSNQELRGTNLELRGTNLELQNEISTKTR